MLNQMLMPRRPEGEEARWVNGSTCRLVETRQLYEIITFPQ
jgi:hypothetical protein